MINAGKATAAKTVMFAAACLLAGAAGLSAASLDANGSVWTENPDFTSVSLAPAGTTARISIVSMAEWADPLRNSTDPRAAVVLVDSGVPGSVFAGNFLAAGVRGFSLRVESTCSSEDVSREGTRVFIRAPSGREWGAPLSLVAGQTTVNRLMLDYTLWSCTGAGTKPPYTAWVSDLSGVAEVGVCIVPWGTAVSALAQTFTLSEFHLVGDNGVIGPAATLTAGQRSGLLNRFGVLQFENVASDRGVDTDGDGVADYYEIMVGTDWNKGDDQFASKIAASPAGIVLRWRCNAGVYNVLRADGDINNGFNKVSIDGAEDLETSSEEEAAGYMQRTDAGATGNGPYFYRVLRARNKQ